MKKKNVKTLSNINICEKCQVSTIRLFVFEQLSNKIDVNTGFV